MIRLIWGITPEHWTLRHEDVAVGAERHHALLDPGAA